MTNNQLTEMRAISSRNSANSNSAGFKQTEIGLIPDDWEVYSVAQAFEVCNNLRFPLSAKTRESMSGEYPYYGPTKVQDYLNEYRVEGEYALIGEDGDHFLKFDVMSQTQYVSGKFNVNNHAHLIKGKLASAKWFFWFFRNRDISIYLSRQGAGRFKLNKASLMTMLLAVPSTNEQTAITNALSDVDALIQELEKLIAKKQAIKTATMQQLLTGRTRLPQFAYRADGSKKGYKQSALGEIPEDWEVLSLGTASSFINGRAYALYEWETNGTPVIRLQNLTGRGEDYYYSNMQLPEKQYCEDGDLLFMWSATFGPVIWRGPKAIYHYHIWKIICNQEFSRVYMFFLLDDMTEKLKSGSSSGGTMLHVTKGKMETTKAVFPLSEEQNAIANILSDMDDEIQVLEQRLSKTRQIKQGMMQELLTGKTRLIQRSEAT